MRVLIAVVLVASAGLYLGYGGNKKDAATAATADDQGDKLKAAKKKFGEEFDDLIKRFQAATTPAEKKGIQVEAKELAVITAGKVLKIAEDDPKSATALDAAEFAFGKLVSIGASGGDIDKLIGIVSEHHINSPKVKDLVMRAGGLGAAGEKLLTAAAEKSTNKEVKGLALFFLGSSLGEQADDAPNEKASAELTAKAIDYLQRAAKEAPDAKLGDDTLAKLAETEITALKTLSVGNTAPDLAGTDLKEKDGKKTKLSSLKGKVVLIDVWATWCGPCRAMIPHEREMVKKMDGKPFVLISVSADESKDALTKFIEKEPMPWTHWWDGDQSPVLKTLRVKAFPTLILIDHKGVIRKKWIGAPEPEVLDKAVEEIVKEAAKKG